jgi:hypothetical protein
MSARIVKIDKIEGNSNLGNPVFSKYGKMQNFQYLVLSPVQDDIGVSLQDKRNSMMKKEDMQFKIKKNLMDLPGVKIGSQDEEVNSMSTKEKRDQIQKILVSTHFVFSFYGYSLRMINKLSKGREARFSR